MALGALNGAATQPAAAPLPPSEGSAFGAAGVDASGLSVGAKHESRMSEGASTDPKFGDVLQRVQAQYGAKAGPPARSAKKTLDKDDFLKIMISQMKHQDPTSPFKADQMAQQMAQFASVEQMSNVNQTLKQMAVQNRPLEQMAMTNLIGKTITMNRDRFQHSEGSPEALTFALSRAAKEVKVLVGNELGEAVFETTLGPQSAGSNTITWDGNRIGTAVPTKSGFYQLKVIATDDQGITIPIASERKGQVIGVSFDGPEPVFLVGDARHQEKVPLKQLVRIEQDFGAALGRPPGAVPGGRAPETLPLGEDAAEAASASGAADVPPASSPRGPAVFTFEKGKGSQTIAPPAALAQQLASAAAPAPAKAEGFANGLRDGDDDPSLGQAAPDQVSRTPNRQPEGR